MARDKLDYSVITLLAVRLVQPGMLGDVHLGVVRLSPGTFGAPIEKQSVHDELEDLIELGMVERYATRRYILTGKGEDYVNASGIREKIDGRRMYLLKETRRNKF